MIFITGLGRCGTTLMTLVYKELGFGVGHSLSYNEDHKAGMELTPAYAISRDMYDSYLRKGKEIDLYEKSADQYWGSEYGDTCMRERILYLDTETPPDRKEGVVEVIKDPRLTWHPKLIRAWWMVRKDIKLIILHRKPENIIKSRSNASIAKWGNDTHFHDPKRFQRVQQFYDDWEEFYHEVKVLGIPHVLWNYPAFTTYPKRDLFVHLQGIGAMKDYTLGQFEIAWDNVFDESKITFFDGEK